MERGQVGGLNYKMPILAFGRQQEQQAAPQQQVQGEDFEVSMEDLDGPEEKLKALYENYGLLKSILTDLERKGIQYDVPDYSQPDGGIDNRTYLKAKANVMYAAQELANEKRKRELATQAHLANNIRYNSDYNPNEDMLTPDSYYTTEVDPATLEANKRTGQSYYTNTDVNAVNQQIHDPNVAGLANRYGGEALQYQQSAAQPAVKETYAPTLTPQKKAGDDGRYDFQIGLLRKFTNLKSGNWPEGSYTTTTVGGKVYMKNPENSGDSAGKYIASYDKNGSPVYKEKIVDGWFTDPDTGKVYIGFTDPNLPMEDVSTQSGDAITRTFISNNSKYGSVDKVMEAASAVGLTNEYGSSVDPMLTPQNAQEIQGAVRGKGAAASKRVMKAKKDIEDKLSALQNGYLSWNYEKISLPNGNVIEIGKHKTGDGYFINNPEKLVTPEAPNGYDSELVHLSIDEVKDWLAKGGYFNQFLNEKTTEVDPDI